MKTAFFVGLFLGFLITYNWVLKDINYQISFYGFEEVKGEVVPIIKLRKKLRVNPGLFGRRDYGIEIGEVHMPPLRKGAFQFDDKAIDGIIRSKYCHD